MQNTNQEGGKDKLKARKLFALITILLLISIGCSFTIPGLTISDADATLNAISRHDLTGTMIVLRGQQEQLNQMLTETARALPETPTPTPTVSWEGNWTIWIVTDQPYQLTMTLSEDGNTISSTSTSADGKNVGIFEGLLSADHSVASGTWEDSNGFSGDFVWQQQTNPNQFIGNYSGNNNGGTFAFCGARDGASRPDPCFGP